MLPWREPLGQGAGFPVEGWVPSWEAVVVPSWEAVVVPSWEAVAPSLEEEAVVPSLEVGGVCRPRYHTMEGRSAFEEIGRSTL